MYRVCPNPAYASFMPDTNLPQSSYLGLGHGFGEGVYEKIIHTSSHGKPLCSLSLKMQDDSKEREIYSLLLVLGIFSSAQQITNIESQLSI